MTSVMTERVARKLNSLVWHLICVLVLIGASVLSGSVSRAQSPEPPSTVAAAPPEIEAATIKPVKEPSPNNMHDSTEGRRLSMRYTSLRDLMMMAYEVDPRQIVGGPAWVTTDEFDIDLVVSEGVQVNQREEAVLAELMADRFQLKFHREQRLMNVYVLQVAKGGPKLKAADANSVENSGCEHLGVCNFHKRTLANFARFMQFVVMDRPVVDKTGIAGEFDFTLRWTPEESQFNGMGFRVPVPDGTAPLPGLFTAIQEQLGLRLEPQKIPAEVLVIDHVEQPSEN
jgi:uncharacterized protein (TIGR03435 family)